MSAGNSDTLDQLPHRPPFLFLTDVLHLERRRRGEAIWRVTGREDYLRGHFPSDPIVPGVLITEALAQLAGLVAFFSGTDSDQATHGASANASPAKLAHIDCRFDSAVRPPAEIHLSAETVREFGRLWQFAVSARVETTVVARGRLTLAGPIDGTEDGAAPSS